VLDVGRACARRGGGLADGEQQDGSAKAGEERRLFAALLSRARWGGPQ
jgi:hypothetical protein